jgi:photosynthetic reaction center cytochrome c subunit
MTESLEGKTAVQAFKNVQVLKDIPATELLPTMQFIAGSLGVECGYCHVMGHFEADDKETKKTARKMIQMELAIDKDNFNGEQEVTCATCHNGSPHPKAVPTVAENSMPTRPMGMRPPGGGEGGGEGMRNMMASLPRPDAILAKYIDAVGGADALDKVKTRVEKGTTEFFGREVPVELTEKAPNMRISVMTMPNGHESTTAVDGKTGWMAGGFGPQGAPHAMTSAESAAAQLDATLAFPNDLKTLFRVFRPRPPEQIDGKNAYVLFGLHPGQPPTQLYFDEASGLLVRVVSFEQTALGRLPQQIDFSDYRDADGVKVPYSWTISRPQSRFTIKITSVEQNVPVEDSKFAMPAAASNTQ